jgi:hypothetical protein
MSIVGLGLVLAAAITPLSVANWPQTTVVDAGLLGADVGQYASMAVLPSGQPAISYFDAASRNLLYAQRDPNGTWAVTIVATAVGIPVGTANVYNSLAIVGGEPAISFYATNGAGALKYVRRTGVVWPVPESVDSGQLCGAYNSLAVLDPNDPNGNPAISYLDQGNSGLKYATKSAGVWTTTTVDPNAVQGFTSLAFIPNPNNPSQIWPAISYCGAGSHLTFAWNDGAWHRKVVDTVYQCNDTSLAVIAGQAAIAFFDSSHGDLAFARHTGTSLNFGWLKSTAAQGSPAVPVGRYPSLLEHPTGAPMISYYDSDPNIGGLSLAYWADPNQVFAAWNTTRVDGPPPPDTVGLYTSLRAVNNLPVIGYYDQTNGNLKYAVPPDCNTNGIPDDFEPPLAATAPTSAASDPNSLCTGDAGTISLSATGGSGTTLRWFNDSCGGTSIGTGNPLVIASPTATTTYYARWENSCGISACTSVTVAVNPRPATPTSPLATPPTTCTSQPSVLSATVGSGETVDWFTGSCGGTPVTSPVSPTTTTTYYARARNTTTGCTSAACASVTVTVNPRPATPTSPLATPPTTCTSQPSVLSATVGGGETVEWFTDSCGGAAVTSPVSPTTTTTYYARARNTTTGCVSATCASVTVTVNPQPATPTSPLATPDTTCAGQPSVLSATVGGGETVEWFTDSCGGTPATSPVSPTTTTTYYARALNTTTGCISAACATTTVTVVPCGATGACCVGASCQNLTAAECAALLPVPGIYYGDGSACYGTSCPSVGCKGDMNCDGHVTFVDIDLFVQALSGESAWNVNHLCPWFNADANNDLAVTFTDIDPFVALIGTTCPSGGAATGACCYPDGTCGVTTQANCTNSWLGAASLCSACPQPGACCSTTGTCAVITQTACTSAGGHYFGNSTACRNGTQCPASCRGDMNCDGHVTFVDIDLFVQALSGETAWTHWPCPWFNADANGDLAVTFVDIDPFVALIGTTCPS